MSNGNPRRRRSLGERIQRHPAWPRVRATLFIVLLGVTVVAISSYLAHQSANSDLQFLAPPNR